jgi:hypothetical protein
VTVSGIRLIGSTQEFSKYFLANCLIIAVAWSLCSSALLGLCIKMLGGTRLEAAAGFLAMMGLRLVVMQVEATPFLRQSWVFVSLTKETQIGQVRRATQTNQSAARDRLRPEITNEMDRLFEEDFCSDLVASKQEKDHQRLGLYPMRSTELREMSGSSTTQLT